MASTVMTSFFEVATTPWLMTSMRSGGGGGVGRKSSSLSLFLRRMLSSSSASSSATSSLLASSAPLSCSHEVSSTHEKKKTHQHGMVSSMKLQQGSSRFYASSSATATADQELLREIASKVTTSSSSSSSIDEIVREIESLIHKSSDPSNLLEKTVVWLVEHQQTNNASKRRVPAERVMRSVEEQSQGKIQASLACFEALMSELSILELSPAPARETEEDTNTNTTKNKKTNKKNKNKKKEMSIEDAMKQLEVEDRGSYYTTVGGDG